MVYGQPKFAAVITAVSLFIAFVLHKAYNPYRANTAFSLASELLGRDITPTDTKKKKAKYVPTSHVCVFVCVPS